MVVHKVGGCPCVVWAIVSSHSRSAAARWNWRWLVPSLPCWQGWSVGCGTSHSVVARPPGGSLPRAGLWLPGTALAGGGQVPEARRRRGGPLLLLHRTNRQRPLCGPTGAGVGRKASPSPAAGPQVRRSSLGRRHRIRSQPVARGLRASASIRPRRFSGCSCQGYAGPTLRCSGPGAATISLLASRWLAACASRAQLRCALLRRSVSSFAIISRRPRAAERGPLGPSAA